MQGAARLGHRLSGGYRNLVHAVALGGELAVVRWSRRGGLALDWELDLLAFLAGRGLRVPDVVPAADGRRVVDGCVVFTWLDGEPPASEADWWAVAATLDRLHELTVDWPQRPGFAGTRELLSVETGGDVRLDLMPPEAVEQCRRAWRPLAAEPRTVVHGDPGAQNIRITAGGVGLLDWDEVRVDAAILDAAALPLPLTGRRLAVVGTLTPERLAAVTVAADAWEAANGWLIEPDYARRRLRNLDGGGQGAEGASEARGGQEKTTKNALPPRSPSLRSQAPFPPRRTSR